MLDTETTGLEPEQGHRVIEIAGVELVNRRLTGNDFHRYLDPERDSEVGALEVHGLSTEFLRGKPKFHEIAGEFLDFVQGAELVIHNAAFDVAFLDRELDLAGLKPLSEYCAGVVDTLRMARELHPGKRNALDALCERYGIDNSARTLHGALLDARLLGEVYLAMTRGQESLIMAEVDAAPAGEAAGDAGLAPLDLVVIAAAADEIAAHEQRLADIDKASKGKCLWLKLEG